MNITAFLYLPALTRSVSFRPYLSTPGSRPILQSVADRILRRSGAGRLVILHHYPAEEDRLLEALAGSRAELQYTPHFSELQAIASAARDDSAETFAILKAGIALTPADLLYRVARVHRERQSDCTLIPALPEDCSMCLCDAEPLQQMAQLADTFSFAGVEDAIRRLLGLKQVVGQRAPLQISCNNFDFHEAYSVTPQQLPVAVPLREERELALADAAVQQANQDEADPDTAAILMACRQLQTLRKEKDCQIPADCQIPTIEPLPTPPRVLFLSLPSAFSGAEQSLCSMLRFLDHDRYEPWAVTVRSGVFADTMRQAGAQVICPEASFMDANTATFSYMLQLLHRVRPAILHLNSSVSLGILAAASVCNIPIVLHLRNGDMGGYEDCIVQSKAMIAVSDFLRREALRFPVDARKIHVIYDETDSERFDPALFDRQQCRQELGLAPQERIALMVARVVPNKRHDLMLEAAGLVRQRIPDFRMIFKGDVYGDSLYHRQIQNLQKMLELDETVRWIDFVPDMRKLMAASDLLALCSDREGLGSCVVEAMSMGLPVVVTNSGGSHEIVEHGVSGGFVVPSGEAGELAARMIDLLRDQDLRERLGSAGREYVRANLDGRVSAGKIMEIYDTLLGKNSA